MSNCMVYNCRWHITISYYFSTSLRLILNSDVPGEQWEVGWRKECLFKGGLGHMGCKGWTYSSTHLCMTGRAGTQRVNNSLLMQMPCVLPCTYISKDVCLHIHLFLYVHTYFMYARLEDRGINPHFFLTPCWHQVFGVSPPQPKC